MTLSDPISDLFNGIVEPVEKATGFSTDITKQLLSFLFLWKLIKYLFYSFVLQKTYEGFAITFSFAFLWPKFKTGNARHSSSLLTGLILLLFTYGLYPTLGFLGMVLIAYIIIASGIGQHHPYIVFVWSLIVLHATFDNTNFLLYL